MRTSRSPRLMSWRSANSLASWYRPIFTGPNWFLFYREAAIGSKTREVTRSSDSNFHLAIRDLANSTRSFRAVLLMQSGYYPTHSARYSTLAPLPCGGYRGITEDRSVRSLALVIAFLIGAVSGLYIQLPELPEGKVIDSKIEIRRRVD